MKLALHRSVTFWSAILVMAFICWAWWDSYHSASGFRYERVAGMNSVGGVLVERDSHLESNVPFRNRGYPRVRPQATPPPFFLRGADKAVPAERKAAAGPPTLLEYGMNRYQGSPSDHWGLFIPHWLLLLAVAIPWTALLLWRARRRKPRFSRLKLAP